MNLQITAQKSLPIAGQKVSPSCPNETSIRCGGIHPLKIDPENGPFLGLRRLFEDLPPPDPKKEGFHPENPIFTCAGKGKELLRSRRQGLKYLKIEGFRLRTLGPRIAYSPREGGGIRTSNCVLIFISFSRSIITSMVS